MTDMNWETVIGIITVLSAISSLISVVLKINRTLVSLEEAVKRLTAFVEQQGGENRSVRNLIYRHEQRLLYLEETLHLGDRKHTKQKGKEEPSE